MNTTASNNLFIGNNAGDANQITSDNVLIGNDAGGTLIHGAGNVFVGLRAGYYADSSWGGVYIGTDAGHCVQNARNTNDNICIGNAAGYNNYSGTHNLFLGSYSGRDLNNGNENIFIGFQSAMLRTTGSSNILIGNRCAEGNSGSNNVFVGNEINMSFFNSGSRNVFLGYRAGYYETGSDKLYIANSEVNPPLIYGDFAAKYVGLGTTGPESTLHIEKTTAGGMGADLVLANKSSTLNTAVAIDFGVDNTSVANGAGNAQIKAINMKSGGGDGTDITFSTWSGSAFDERMRIQASGNIGVGTITPLTAGGSAAKTFHLKATDFPQYIYEASNATTNNKIWRTISRSTNNSFQIQTLDDAGSSELTGLEIDRSGNSITNVLFPNGNVGVGRTPTANKLEVEGNASKTTATAWLANSDKRIKTNIEDIENSFETILKLRPVKFKYKDEWKKRHPSIEDKYYYNFIAQEYQNVFPESVKGSGEFLENDSKEILQIDTYNAQIVTIKAVQDLIKENSLLKNEISNLKFDNAQLKAESQSMKSDIEKIKKYQSDKN